MGRNDEALIQVKIVKYLQSRGIYFFSVPNEAAAENKIRQMQLVSMGLRSGVSDLIMLYPKRSLTFLEVKTQKGKQSDKQKKFESRVCEHGFKYYVVRSVEDVAEILTRIDQGGS